MNCQFVTVAAGAILFSAAAAADMNGLEIVLVGTNLVDPAEAGGDNYTVDVFAQMDLSNRLDAVAGNSGTTKLVATSGAFYQNGFCGPTSPQNNDAFWSAQPSMEFDSFVTIGCLSAGCSGDANTLQTVGIDWTDFESGGEIVADNGTWFVTPDQSIGGSVDFAGTCGGSTGVLVARLTVIGMDSNIEFNALFQGRDSNNVTWQAEHYGDYSYNDYEYGDCNTNGILDGCDFANGVLHDDNDDGVYDECESNPYVNLNSGLVSDTAAEAIFAADNGDSIEALAEYFNAEATVDMLGKGLYMDVVEGDISTSANVTMGPGSVLDGGYYATFDGALFSSFSGNSHVQATQDIMANGLVYVRSGASLELEAGISVVMEDSVINSGGSLGVMSNLANDGAMTMLGDAVMLAYSTTNNGLMRTSGTLLTDLYNNTSAEVQCGGDTVLSGSLNNDGTVSVNVGTLYVLGSLTNNGTIVGDVDEGPGFTGGGNEPGPGDGFAVGGSYHAGAGASLHMPHANWTISIGGDVNIAINDSDRFTMEDATVALTGASGDLQHLEAMSVDVDSSTDGLDHAIDGHFTLGQLIVRSGSTVLVVDNHDNAEGGAESIYVKHLVIEAGATLDAGDRAVWYETAQIDGIAIGDIDVVADPCPGDADGSGDVNIDDLLAVIGTFNDLCPDGCDTDFDDDGMVTIDDLLIVIGFFGPCP